MTIIFARLHSLAVVLLAENEAVQEKLRNVGIEVETVDGVKPIEVYPARVLSYIYAQLGWFLVSVIVFLS